MTSAHDLAGRRVIVTGAGGGIGSRVCAELAAGGANLALVGRREQPLEQVAATLPGGPHAIVPLDVTDQEQWTGATPRLAPDGLLHGLVTAAAELRPVGPIGSWAVSAFRRTLDINVIGTLLPIAVLLGPLRAAAGSVVTYSGGGATGPFPRYDAYASSKAAVVRLTENLAVELKDQGVRINCVSPGFVLTDLHDATLEAGPGRAGEAYYERTRRARHDAAGDPPELAAGLTAFLLSDGAAGITGRLISARWDPWRDPQFQDRLRREPDLATLRRIDGHFFSPLPSTS